jgi:hypothetical protein
MAVAFVPVALAGAIGTHIVLPARAKAEAGVGSNLSVEIDGGRVAAADEHGEALPRRGLVTSGK